MKLLKQYENITQQVLFAIANFSAMMSGRKYDVIPQNVDSSRESNVRNLVFRNNVRFKMERRYRTQYGKDPLQIILSDVG
jgi:hypothetical protein